MGAYSYMPPLESTSLLSLRGLAVNKMGDTGILSFSSRYHLGSTVLGIAVALKRYKESHSYHKANWKHSPAEATGHTGHQILGERKTP